MKYDVLGIVSFPELRAFLIVGFHNNRTRIASYDVETLFYRHKKYSLYNNTLKIEQHEDIS